MAADQYYVYIRASRPYGTLYVGVTRDLVRRGWEHRHNQVAGFTRQYGVHRLAHFEVFGDINLALAREKRLKRCRRDWKTAPIKDANPDRSDSFQALDGWNDSARLGPG